MPCIFSKEKQLEMAGECVNKHQRDANNLLLTLEEENINKLENFKVSCWGFEKPEEVDWLIGLDIDGVTVDWADKIWFNLSIKTLRIFLHEIIWFKNWI